MRRRGAVKRNIARTVLLRCNILEEMFWKVLTHSLLYGVVSRLADLWCIESSKKHGCVWIRISSMKVTLNMSISFPPVYTPLLLHGLLCAPRQHLHATRLPRLRAVLPLAQ
jgi:hypothetical protein